MSLLNAPVPRKPFKQNSISSPPAAAAEQLPPWSARSELTMPQDSIRLERGEYANLSSANAAPSASADDNVLSSDSSDLSDVEEFDPLNYDAGSLKRTRVRKGSFKKSRSAFDANGSPRKSLLERWLVPSKMSCFLILLFVGSTGLLLTAGGIWAWSSAPENGLSPPWYPAPLGGEDKSWETAYEKAAKLVSQMTLAEKVNVTTGTGWMMNQCVGNTGPVPRLGFPSLCLQDGPLGIRFADNITVFPAGITVGATWNRDLMYKRGRAHALEARLKGVNVLLGPCMGPLGRSPLGGRNWEGFGADPVLQGVAGAETIRGIQDEGIIATAKHWVGNEQEHYRQSWEWGLPNGISSNIDDRTLHELYAWPFADAVKAGVASVMCSYNQVNNSYACGNALLQNGILKDEFGFQGFIQSDWLAQRGGVSSALAGLDVTMPGDGLRWMDGNTLWGQELTKAVLNTSVPVERLNDMVTRVVAAWYQLGQDNKSKFPDEGPNFSSWTDQEIGLIHPASDDKTKGVVNKFVDVQGRGEGSHGYLVRQIAAEGTVLLKNEDDLLPLTRSGLPQDGKLFGRAGKNQKVNIGIFGEDSRNNRKGINSCENRACNIGTVAQGWGSGAAEYPYLIAPVDALEREFDANQVQLTTFEENDIPDARKVELLGHQDICFAFINAIAGEGFVVANGMKGDRNDLYAQKGGDALVKTVAENCGNGKGSTIVVVHAVGAIVMENWIDLPGVKAVLHAHLPGEESGNALADIIFGDVNPSGKLPYTIGKSLEDYGSSAPIITKPNGLVPQQNFSEGLYIDYRHFDKYDIDSRFEFGYGLSYTQWQLSGMDVVPKQGRTALPKPRPDAESRPPKYDTSIPDAKEALLPAGFRKLKKYIYPYISSTSDVVVGEYPYPDGYATPASPSQAGGGPGGNPDLYTVFAEVTTTLINIGNRDGAAVVQLYLSYPTDYRDEETGEVVDFPIKVLRGFQKVYVLGGGQNHKSVTFELTRRDLSYWCTRRQNWVMPTTGTFRIAVGFSSRELPIRGGLKAV